MAAGDGYLVPNGKTGSPSALIDGNFVRRDLELRSTEYPICDSELPGFGLRVRPSGRHVWFVRLRHRGKQRRISLGKVEDVDAVFARTQARRFLAEVALDGLPKREALKTTPTLTEFVAHNWPDIARYWKPSTQSRNRHAWKRELEPVFGGLRVADITKADVTRWRLGLQWQDVNGHRVKLRDSKTGPRTVWLGDEAWALIAKLRRARSVSWLFFNPGTGRPIRHLQHYWAEIRGKAGLRDVLLHDLRHTFASHAAMQKETLPMIGRLLGHAKPQSTSRYAHLGDDYLVEAAELVGAAVERLLGDS